MRSLASALLVVSILVANVHAQDDMEKDACVMAQGWSYASASASASAGGGGGAAGGGYSMSSSSAACIQAEIPSDCIRANPLCAWCAQTDFSGSRCNLESALLEQACEFEHIQTVKSSVVMESSSGSASQRFSYSRASAAIRVGDSVQIPFVISEPKIYPVDFYYLMDVSYSMKEDLKQIQSLGSALVQKLEDLTQGASGSVRLGFGKFVDKVQSPMTQMTPFHLKHPYVSWTEPPFLYKNVVNLTSDVDTFERLLKKENVSGNLDPPEGALDAMLQVVECQKLINWRPNALRLLMIATESAFHYAGDGSGYLAGISKANDGACHTGGDGKYVGAEQQDYPSINQVVRSVEKHSITPIFAVRQLYADLYQYISENYFRGSTWGVLEGDSSNVVELVEKAYKDITGKQELVTANPDESVLCPWYSWSIPGQKAQMLSVHGTRVENLESGSKVNYTLFLAAHRAACTEGAECYLGDVDVKTRRYDEKLSVDTKILGAFGCQANVEFNSSLCYGHGDFSCGICTCYAGWKGAICNNKVGEKGCIKLGDSQECSGRGTCVNDICICDPGYRHLKEKIFGQFCECDECPIRAGLVCSGHGTKSYSGCSCICECEPGWSGTDCGCPIGNDNCLAADGLVCSSRGKCECGVCLCEEGRFGGPLCDTCLVDCPTCGKLQDCVQCTMYQTGPKNQTCIDDCEKDVPVHYADPESIDEETAKESGHHMCVALDASDNCKFYYKYKELPDGSMDIYAEREKRCKPAYSLIIVLWCILIVLLIGLILLCCWRCCVYIIDKEEEKNYRLSSLAKYTAPALVPLLPAMGAGSVIEFIKAKYLMRRSAKVAVIPVRRSFFAGKTNIMWKTYAGSAGDDDFEVLSEGEEGTLARKRHVERVRQGDSVVEMEPLGAGVAGFGGNGAAAAASDGYRERHTRGTNLSTVDETMPLLEGYNWGSGELVFADGDEFASIEIPLTHDFSGRETMFWVELYGQEKGVALGLKRTKVIVIKDEDAGVLGFPKPNYVFKENDQLAIIPVHRTIGMDGKVSVGWFSRDITAVNGKHYNGGRGILNFDDGEVTKHIEIELIPDIIYDDSEKAFNIELEDPKGGATLDLAHCMITVLCDEECALVQFPKEAYPFMENCGIADIPVIRTRSTKGACAVKWRTEDITAFAGKDYVASEGVLTFPNAVTEAHIQIPIIDNTVFDEAGRSFRVLLFDPSESTKLAQQVATVSIIEDDEPGLFEFAKTSIVLRSSEGVALIGHLPVVRSLGTDGHITIPWIIQNHDNEKIPPEVAAMSGSVEFAHGEITHGLELDLSGVPQAEMMTFEVVLLLPTGGGKLGHKNKATVTVFGEEDAGSVSFAQPHFETMATCGMATLLVSRKGNLDNAAFVMYETCDQTAVSGTHYRGGTSSLVFEAKEAAKEIGIPVYNDPNHTGQLTFNVSLKSTPGGPKIGDISAANVAIICTPMTPVIHAGAAPPGPCMVELVKPKYLVRKSAKIVNIPVHRSSSNGACIVEWGFSPGPDTKIRRRQGSTSSSSSSSSSSEESNLSSVNVGGKIKIPDNSEHANISLNVEESEAEGPQMSLFIHLLNVWWEDDKDESIRLGLKKAEVVVLNDVDAGTLGFPKSNFSFNVGEGVVILPVHRLGGMDGDVAVQWCTRDDVAIAGRDYERDSGTLKFANNQIIQHIRVRLLPAQFSDHDREKQFTVELGQATGGAKTGTRTANVKIIGEQDRSIVQFSKPSYPVIGNSTSVKIPVLRTGDSQNKVVVQWYTEDETAKQGLDYKLCRDFLTFEPDATRAEVEVPLSGRTTEPKTFRVVLADPRQGQEQGRVDNVILGENSVATVAIISSREPGTFEFSKPSFVFKTSSGSGLVPVVRSNGTDGHITLPWRIESRSDMEQSPFAGAEGHLQFEDGQVSASVEVGLQGVPSNAFVLVLLPPAEEGTLGSTSRATVTIIGEAEEPIIEMDPPRMSVMTNEVIKATVLRRGNLDETTCVGWRTEDGTAFNGKHFIGGTGNVVLNPGEESKEIIIPVVCPPAENTATFYICLTDVRGLGKIGDSQATEVTMEPMPSKYMDVLQQSVMPETYVEFLRKRHHFQQSQGSAMVPVHRSDTRGILTLRWETDNLTPAAAKKALAGLDRRASASSSSSEEEEDAPRQRHPEEEEPLDWGSGTITFDDGERETAIELILYRDLPTKETNFRITLSDPWDNVNFGVKETIVTVLKDRDPGSLGFASPMYDFSCNERELVIPVHRSSGADGTVSVPWFTRDGTAIGGTHYLPDDGNLVFRDGEVLRKITVPMPRKAAIFGEDEVAFELVLGEPTGGAVLGTNAAMVVLRNDVVPSLIGFSEPLHFCKQSSGTVCVPVCRSQGMIGKVVVPWRAVSAPGKPKSRYEGMNDGLVFKDNEDQKMIELPLPKGLQPTEQDFFVLELSQPKAGRAQLSDNADCYVTVDNDTSMGTFSLSSPCYSFSQSEGRGCITVLRTGGSEGEATLSWKIKSTAPTSSPSILHNKRGVTEFNPGQTEAKIEIPLPKDSEHSEESFVLALSPPGGRGKLGEPNQAELLLKNDVECSVGFPQPLFETRGDMDTFLLPVTRDGPKGRSVSLKYRTHDGTAKDLQHFIGEEGNMIFGPGEDRKDILIPILNDPDGERVLFEVELYDLEGPGHLGGNSHATVAIDNLAGPGIFIMASSEMDVKQSSGTAMVTVLRTHGRRGAVELPWFVEQVPTVKGARKPSNYDSLEGKLTFADGEGQKILEIPLEASPQDDTVTKFDTVLLTPTSGAGATLGDVTSTRVTVDNDIDGGTLEMAADRVEVFGTDKEVNVPVIRTGATDHKCYVAWEVEDVTAVRGKHYKGGRGNLSFEPGEKTKKITIPIINDPMGGPTSFNVVLGETKGGAKVGDKKQTEVVLDHVRENGEICFGEPMSHFKQTDGKFRITLVRKTGTTGRVVVPWTVGEASEDSPYFGLRGQETFKDGEVESHIELMAPKVPQEKDGDMFKIVLGEPSGGAFLATDSECLVTVENDVLHGSIAFPDETYEVKQSQKEIQIPIVRSKRTEGRVRVPWKTSTISPLSSYAEMSGVETFEDGDKTSHITLQLPQVPTDNPRDDFRVVLDQPKTAEARLGEIASCVVTVHNDLEPALVTFSKPTQEVLQSKSRAHVPIKRMRRTSGRVIVPWKLVPETPDSPYVGAVGESVFEDGDEETTVVVHLPQVALPNAEDKVTLMLEDPIGAKLADDALCNLNITNDIGEGIIEMKSRNVTCCSEDGQATVTVARKLANDFPAVVEWETENDDALSGEHYEASAGKLKFRPGEVERAVHIPLFNDPTGETRHFQVKLKDVQGRDQMGDVTETRVRITNEATPPRAVSNFDATLVGPQAIKASWEAPQEGAPVEGYKVSYWSRPGTTQTIELPPDATEATLEPLEPSTSYQVLVRPYNDVGDGPTSNTIVVDTQPELRLSYDSPIQFKTSEKVALFTLTRNLTTFQTVVENHLIKETRKKVARPQDSSSESSSSSSEEEPEQEEPLQVTELYFEPGQSTATIELPLDQKMKKQSQIYYMRVYPKGVEKEEKPLANIELHIINNTGVPGHVRTPFCASSAPRECLVSWEEPTGGGPVEGYKVTAKGDGVPDVVEQVPAEENKVLLTGLEPATEYAITVQPYNSIGDGKPSSPGHAKTQDELKVEFTERFYTFHMSNKVAIIPIKRHFTHGYTTLNWRTQWTKTLEEVESSSSSSSSEEEDAPNTAWASGAVSFMDGQDTAEVQIPLKQASPPKQQKKRSFFWLYVLDPNRSKRLASMRCGLVDDKANQGTLSATILEKPEAWPNSNDELLVEIRRNGGSFGRLYVQWDIVAVQNDNDALATDVKKWFPINSGEFQFASGDDTAHVKVPFVVLQGTERLTPPKHDLIVAFKVASPTLGKDGDYEETLIILAPENPPGTVSFVVGKTVVPSVDRPDVCSIPIRRDRGNDGVVLVEYSTRDATAKEATHYVACQGIQQFNDGEDEKFINISLLDCAYKEEVMFFLDINNVSNGGEKGLLSSVEVVLSPTQTEPRGQLTFPSEYATSNLKVSANEKSSIRIPLQRVGGTGGKMSMEVSTREVTAKEHMHFIPLAQKVSFSDGQSEESVEIQLVQDTYKEDLQFDVIIQNADDESDHRECSVLHVVLQATYIEPPGKISFVEMPKNESLKCSASESDSVVIPIRRSDGVGGAVSVTLTTVDGTAKGGEHFHTLSETVTFEDGESEKDAQIQLLPAKYTKEKSFKLLLSSPTDGAEIGNTEMNITLLPTYVEVPGSFSFPVELSDGYKASAHDDKVIKIPVNRINGSDGKVILHVKTKDGTARSGKHYKRPKEKVVFLDGETQKFIELPLLFKKHRNQLEFSVLIYKPSGGGLLGDVANLKVFLQPTDTEFCGDLVFPEGDSSLSFSSNKTKQCIIPIHRINGYGGELTATYKTVDGTAKAGEHYKPVTGTLALKPKEADGKIKIPLVPARHHQPLHFSVVLEGTESMDTISESTECIVTLEPTVVHKPGRLQLRAGKSTSLCANDASIARIPVDRVGGSDGPLTLNYRTKDDTALADFHYRHAIGAVVFDDKEMEKFVEVHLLPAQYTEDLSFSLEVDFKNENKETVIQTLNVVLQRTQEEPKGSICFGNQEVRGDKVVMQIIRTGGSRGSIEVNCTARDGTAHCGTHYSSVSETLVFGDGEMEKFLTVGLLEAKYFDDVQLLFNIAWEDGNETKRTDSTGIVLPATATRLPGRINIDGKAVEVSHSTSSVSIPISRYDGCDGDMQLTYETEPSAAQPGEHYIEAKGTITIPDQATRGEIQIPLVTGAKFMKPVDFRVIIKPADPPPDVDVEVTSLTIWLPPTATQPTGRPTVKNVEIKDGQVFISIERVDGKDGDLPVTCWTSDVTAKEGVDYTRLSEEFVMSAGENSHEIVVTLLKTERFEDADFRLNVSYKDESQKDSKVMYTMTLLKTRDRASGKIEIDDNNLQFCSSDCEMAIVPIKRHLGQDGDILLKYYTEEMTALSGVHYVHQEGTILIPDSSEQNNVEIPLISAAEVTNPLEFILNIVPVNPPPDLVTGKTSAVIQIVPPKPKECGFFGFASHKTECCANVDNIVSILVMREHGTHGRVELEYFTRDNTAVAGMHYAEKEGVLVFEHDETEKTIEIELMQEKAYSSSLSFAIEIGTCSAGEDLLKLYETEVVMLPTDDVVQAFTPGDPGVLGFPSPRMYFSEDQSLMEEDALTLEMSLSDMSLQVPVHRTEGVHGQVSVEYFTRDNTAVAGKHYQECQGDLVFEDKQNKNAINIPIDLDARISEDVSFIVELGATTGDADIGIYETEVLLKKNSELEVGNLDGSYITESLEDQRTREERTSAFVYESVKMVEDSAQYAMGEPGELSFSKEFYRFDPHNTNMAVIDVERHYGHSGQVSVDWFTRENSATSGVDYEERNGTLVFADGEVRQTLHIPLLFDHASNELEKNFIVELGNCDNGATVGRYEATIFILGSHPTNLIARITSPKDAKLEASGPNSVRVTWDPRDNNAQEYWVSFKRAGSRDDPSRRTANPESGLLDIGDLEPESTYAVVLTAVGEGGKQASTEVMSCTTPGNVPGPPNRLVFQVLSPTSLQCSWGEPANPNGVITSYEVMYQPVDRKESEPPVLVRIPDGHYRSLLVEDLEENQPYTYSVRAKNKWGYGPFRKADMKIEHVGSRPPSAIFLDANDATYIQQQQKFLAQEQREATSPSEGETRVTVLRSQQQPVTETTSTSQTKTRVTRYIHRDGNPEPEVETQEFEGRLSQEELNKLAEEGGRIEVMSPSLEVQVITYNTTQRSTSGTGPSTQYYEQTEAPSSIDYDPEEYSTSDTRTDVTQDVQEFTDVQQSKEGDADVTTITKTYKTTTTERRLDTHSGMRKVMVPSPTPDSRQQKK